MKQVYYSRFYRSCQATFGEFNQLSCFFALFCPQTTECCLATANPVEVPYRDFQKVRQD